MLWFATSDPEEKKRNYFATQVLWFATSDPEKRLYYTYTSAVVGNKWKEKASKPASEEQDFLVSRNCCGLHIPSP